MVNPLCHKLQSPSKLQKVGYRALVKKTHQLAGTMSTKDTYQITKSKPRGEHGDSASERRTENSRMSD